MKEDPVWLMTLEMDVDQADASDFQHWPQARSWMWLCDLVRLFRLFCTLQVGQLSRESLRQIGEPTTK